jgi:hypothetical protein
MTNRPPLSKVLRETLALGVIGLVTGLATAFINPFTGSIDALMKDIVASSALGRFAWKWIAMLGPGALFGLTVGGYLYLRVRHSWLRWASLVVFSTGSWLLAILAVVMFTRAPLESIPLPPDPYARALPGLIGGLVGAGLLAALMARLYAFFRGGRPVLVMLFAGGLAGVPLFYDGFLVTFPLWQCVVAAAIGWALGRSRQQDRRRSECDVIAC